MECFIEVWLVVIIVLFIVHYFCSFVLLCYCNLDLCVRLVLRWLGLCTFNCWCFLLWFDVVWLGCLLVFVRFCCFPGIVLVYLVTVLVVLVLLLLLHVIPVFLFGLMLLVYLMLTVF